jgi:hypothetical protein
LRIQLLYYFNWYELAEQSAVEKALQEDNTDVPTLATAVVEAEEAKANDMVEASKAEALSLEGPTEIDKEGPTAMEGLEDEPVGPPPPPPELQDDGNDTSSDRRS